jgi:hypothetical protein
MNKRDRENRVDRHLDRGNPFWIFVDGNPIQAYPGETIAAALLASGRRGFRRTTKRNQHRGLYCGMGVCWDCVMVANGRPNVRTCITSAEPGMKIETQMGLGPKFNT